MERDSQILIKGVEDYHLEVNGVKFWTPYWINWETPPYFKDALLVGKGSAAEIIQTLLEKINESEADPKTPADYRSLMRQHGLGIDCSGLAWYVLSGWLRQAYGLNLADSLFVPKSEVKAASKKPSWRETGVSAEQLESLPDQITVSAIIELFHKQPQHLVNVARLTSDQSAVTVASVAGARPGDLIKMTGPAGDHVGVIVEVGRNIRYADSRDVKGGSGGVRYQDITVNDSSKGLEAQDWSDKADFDPTKGDRLCRLKVIDDRS